jgi:hypothetical protein
LSKVIGSSRTTSSLKKEEQEGKKALSKGYLFDDNLLGDDYKESDPNSYVKLKYESISNKAPSDIFTRSEETQQGKSIV